LYISDGGVLVTAIDRESGLNGPAGLRDGHIVYGVNHCRLHNEHDWYACLSELKRTNYGYCVPRKDVAQQRADKVVLVF